MNFPRTMPNIKPYPHQDLYTDIPQKHYSVYRPAYHRTPTTSKNASRQNKEAWNSPLPEASPIVVPSMSTASIQSHYLDFYQSNANLCYATSLNNYYPQMQPIYRNSTNIIPNYHQAISHSNTVMHQFPIHHTLENATITYDTTDENLQKELVKDVFFSPAMVTSGRKLSPAGSSYSSMIDSVCATSDSESDSCTVSTSPETPSDLLLDENQDCLFDFGLDLATTSSTSLSKTSSYEEVIMAAGHKKKPSFTISDFESAAFQLGQQSDFLPTPLTAGEQDYAPHHSIQNKRRCSDSVLQDRMKKKQRTNNTSRLREHRSTISTTPPLSPPMKKKSIFRGDDSFEDASGEDSSDSDSERSFALDSLEHNRFACDSSVNLNAAPEFQLGSVFDSDDDSSSTGSWEEIPEKQQVYFDSASEDEDTFETSASLPKKCKKFTKTSTASVAKPIEENSQSVQEPSENLPKAPPRPTAQPTIYQKLTKANIDWCRYCGTTEGVNWRPGPWGKRTLCNKHGCDYKGYGFACKLPRLDLTGFTKESIDDRDRPVLQLYCTICHQKDSWEGNVLIRCEGCPKAYHQKCLPKDSELTEEFIASKETWYCDSMCCENTKRKRIVVELPRKRLPLMCAPKNSGTSSDLTPRTRSLRETSR